MAKNFWTAIIGSAIVLVACSSSNKSQSVDSLVGVEWKLLSVKAANSDDLLFPNPDKVPTLLFDTVKNTVCGFAGCNRVMGPFEVKGSSLKFGNVASTMMMCVEHMNMENAVTNALQQTDSYRIENGQLILLKGSDVLVIYAR
ncbi:MAG: META domain-containing protein [Prevotellaceae bacterium]|nr:META domain-containing protein [Prevotellaceae bacterium]